ncbi:MAG: transposase, partial [Selenomonadaceae bacterium]|nr:transposase [Selenomonadaceae bacterium]
MANREYKDSFFRFIFNRPPAACSLYRAASQNPAVTEQDIRINTLDSILMDRIKNDVSLLVPGHYVVLLGHQSTWSLNLPLRCLWYISELYRHMIPNKKAMYRTKLIRIPAPQFYVFYIGSPKEPDTSVLHLSDA